MRNLGIRRTLLIALLFSFLTASNGNEDIKAEVPPEACAVAVT